MRLSPKLKAALNTERCHYCGEDFILTRGLSKAGHLCFCSNECIDASIKEKAAKKHNDERLIIGHLKADDLTETFYT